MPRIARIIVPNYPHHITQRGVRSMKVFETANDYQYYIKLLRKNAKKFKLKFLSYCLMPNHLHLIAIPENRNSFAKTLGETQKRYTFVFNERKETKGYLFQGRFFSCPMDYIHLMSAIAYVELNPVVANLVNEPWQYPWSSAAFYVGDRSNDPLVEHSYLLEDIKDWKKFLSQKMEIPKELLKKTRTGRPCGDNNFLKRIENITGRNLQLKKPGRPKINKGTGH
jgi:putative transposase